MKLLREVKNFLANEKEETAKNDFDENKKIL
jgi:hypothetical protein